MFSSTPALYLLDAGSTHPTPPLPCADHQSCLQELPSVPWEQSHPCLWGSFVCLGPSMEKLPYLLEACAFSHWIIALERGLLLGWEDPE